MYEKEYILIKKELTDALLVANAYIDEVESYTAITAPESTLGTILSEQTKSDIKLKQFYKKKRKLMFFLDKLPDVSSFLCVNCKQIIELDRLLLMPKASFCTKCASEN